MSKNAHEWYGKIGDWSQATGYSPLFHTIIKHIRKPQDVHLMHLGKAIHAASFKRQDILIHMEL